MYTSKVTLIDRTEEGRPAEREKERERGRCQWRRKRTPSIFASLFQAEAGWFMRSECRVSTLRENSRFQLCTQPCRQGGRVWHCLHSLGLLNIAVSTTMHLSWMTCNYRPSFSALFLSLSLFLSSTFFSFALNSRSHAWMLIQERG